MLAVDRAVGAEFVPTALRFEPGAANVMLATFIGAIVTIAGFTFWMRSIMVQLASTQFSARVLAAYLQDRFQQSVMGFMVAALTLVVVILHDVPAASGEPMPHLSVLVAVVVTVGALVTMLLAMRRSVSAMQVGELVRRMAESAVDMVRRKHDTAQQRAEPGRELPDGEHEVVVANRTGWVAAIDPDALLEAVPPRTVVRLEVRTGMFVVEDTPLSTVAAPDPGLVDVGAVRSAVTVARQRDRAEDVELRLQELLDIAQQALALGSNDATAAYEVIAHMGWVMREVLCLDATPTGFEGPGERALRRPRELTPEELVRAGFERLRVSGAEYPNIARRLLHVLAFVRDELASAGRHDRVPPIVDVARRTLRTCEQGPALPSEKARVRDFARELGFTGDRAVRGEPVDGQHLASSPR